jgi:hypothetical protein
MKLATNQNDINTTNQRTTDITFSDTSGVDLTPLMIMLLFQIIKIY